MIEIIELKSTGENSENSVEKGKSIEDEIEWYESFPGFRNLSHIENNSRWNRMVFKLDIGDDTSSILKALGNLYFFCLFFYLYIQDSFRRKCNSFWNRYEQRMCFRFQKAFQRFKESN